RDYRVCEYVFSHGAPARLQADGPDDLPHDLGSGLAIAVGPRHSERPEPAQYSLPLLRSLPGSRGDPASPRHHPRPVRATFPVGIAVILHQVRKRLCIFRSTNRNITSWTTKRNQL